MALEQLPVLTSQSSLVERIKYQLSVGAPFVMVKGALGSGKTVICEQLISSMDDTFVKAFIPCSGNSDLTKYREMLLNQLSVHQKFNINDRLVGSIQKFNFGDKKVLIVIDDFDLLIDRFFTELTEVYNTYVGDKLISIVAMTSANKFEQKCRQLKSQRINPLIKEIKPLSIQESIVVMSYYGSQVGLHGMDDKTLKNNKDLLSAKGNPLAIKGIVERMSGMESNMYYPLDRSNERIKAGILLAVGGVITAVIVALLIILFIRNQYKIFDNSVQNQSDAQVQNEVAVIDKMDIEDEKIGEDSLTPELNTTRDNLDPTVVVTEQVNNETDTVDDKAKDGDDSGNIVISDEDNIELTDNVKDENAVNLETTDKNNVNIDPKKHEVSKEEIERKRAEADIEAKAKELQQKEILVKAEAEKKAAQEKARIEVEAKKKEELAKAEAEKKAAQEKARLEAEAKKKEELAKAEAEKKAAQGKARIEVEAKKKEELAKAEAEKKAAQGKARIEVEAKKKEELAKAEAEKKAAQEKARLEAEAKKKEELAKAEAEKKVAQEKARLEAEAKKKEELAKAEAEKKAAEEKARLEAEAKKKEDLARAEAEKKADQERARLEAEAKKKEELARAEAEKKAAQEKAILEAEAKKKEELAKAEAEKKAAQEKARLEAEAKKKEELAKAEAEKKAAQEKAKLEAEAKKKEELAKAEASRKNAEEQKKINAEVLRKVSDESKASSNLSFEELSDSHYTVQLVATSRKSDAERIARQAGNSTWVLFRPKDNQYIVMYGDFSSRNNANKSISTLPESIKKTKPWAKSVAAVKKEIK
ncbi:MAG: AAA family ATPase [Ruminobacter sp.]|nr:AAA family ATPase [Ruminobacter sp.]